MTALFTVTKTWQKPDGTPYVGAVVRFRAQNRVTDAQTGVDVPAGPNDQPNQLNITLDADGHMSHQFYAGWYTVKELFGNYDSYPVEITADGELPTPTLPLPDPPSLYWTAAQTAAADAVVLAEALAADSSGGGGGGGTTLPADASGWLHNNGTGTLAYTTPTAAQVGADLAGAAATEAARATSAENALSSAVAAKADASALTSEASTRAAADTANATAITNEAATARAAEATKVPSTRQVAGHPLSADVTVSKSDVGLGSADNTSDAAKPISIATQTALDLTEKTANKGAANGYAPLDGSSKVPAANLPSYVDDVLEFANLAAFPGTGSTGIIYVADDTNKTYRWGGSSYTEISPSPGSTDAVPEGSTNLYYTNARASAAAPVQSVAGRGGAVSLTKTDVGLANADNTSDANKPVSTAQAAADALNLKIASNLSDLNNAATARTNLGLGTAATHPATDFDSSGAAATAQTAAQSFATSAIATQHSTDNGLYAPITTTTIDLVDRTNNTTETVPAGTTTNCSTAGVTKTAPALAGSVGTPPLRWAVKNVAAGSITVSYPDQAGATQNLTLLGGQTRTFRQKSTSGWGVESGADALATLDARYQPLDSDLTAIAALAPSDGQVLSWSTALGAWTITNPVGNSILAYAENNTGTTQAGLTSGSGTVDVTGCSITVPASTRPVFLWGSFVVQASASPSNNVPTLNLVEVSNGVDTPVTITGAGALVNVAGKNVTVIIPLTQLASSTARSRTFKLQFPVPGAGTWVISNGSSNLRSLIGAMAG